MTRAVAMGLAMALMERDDDAGVRFSGCGKVHRGNPKCAPLRE